MHYVTYGNRENLAVVFLHGWGGSSSSWGIIPKILSGFGFFCVVVDFPGFGESETPTKAYGVIDYKEELKSIIKELGLSRFCLVGHSFGGRVAIKLASQEDGVIKLVLVDSAGVKPKQTIKTKIAIRKYKRLKKKVVDGKLDSRVLDSFGSSDYKLLSPIMKQSFVKIVNEDLINDAKNIKTKTLLIWGKKDEDTPLYMAKKLKKAIVGSSLIVYDAGHFAYLDKINNFIDDLYLFLIG